MVLKLKSIIAKQVLEILNGNGRFCLHKFIRNIKLDSNFPNNQFTFLVNPEESNLSNRECYNLLGIKNIGIINHVRECVKSDMPHLQIIVDQNVAIKSIMDFNLSSNTEPEPKTIIVEFSSPNIAKPFHFGHLRSTIIGNFISNISQYKKHNVIRINYLGDWGTQFGLLKVGLDMLNMKDSIKDNPIRMLYKAYVYATSLQETDEDVKRRALSISHKMEFSYDDNDFKEWDTYRKYTTNELSNIYARLGVVFDEYDWESNYSERLMRPLLNDLKSSGILKNEDGRWVTDLNDRSVPLLKSDGTTLYLTRDIGAVINRSKRYKFDSMLYVVDSSQAKHFRNLISALEKFKLDGAGKVKHVRFGRIAGMSTRKGQAIFLDDILDDAKEMMMQKQKETQTTKVEVGGEVSDILGMTVIIINDLKKRRVSNYNFDSESVFQVGSYSGVKFQYTHCRLVNLKLNSGAILADTCDPDAHQEAEALILINTIGRFEDVIEESYSKLEACILVHYLFDLCDAANRAFRVLIVKNRPDHIASQRLLLFDKARQTLNLGMRILGLKPLDQM